MHVAGTSPKAGAHAACAALQEAWAGGGGLARQRLPGDSHESTEQLTGKSDFCSWCVRLLPLLPPVCSPCSKAWK